MIVLMRKVGMTSFVVGTILFFGDKYVLSALHFLALMTLSPQSQATSFVMTGAYLMLQAGGIILIVAGAVMFIVGGRKEKVAADSK